MKKNKLLYRECINIYQIEESFIEALSEVGLINVTDEQDDKFIEYDEISDLEQYIRWHYDMNINIEGIDAMNHLINKVKAMQSEIQQLTNELKFYKSIF
ncbi:MAG: chaperone modulator CbpM [Fermentimonas sp.]|jgi:MerR family transcriptional regulator/heat shock protein HspR